MPVKIRLQRGGKKRSAFYQIVAADSRASRDGRFIEKVGTYNPNVNPASIDLDFDRALYWIQNGAEPTDTARNILSSKGVMYKNHLLNGVKKGALTAEQVEEKFQVWISSKENQTLSEKEKLSKAKEKEASDRLEAEKQVNEARKKEIQAKLDEAAKAAKAAAAKENETTSNESEETTSEEVSSEPSVE